MKHLFILLTSFLLIIFSCTEKVKAPKPFTPKKPIPEVRIVTEPVEPVNQFKYPKSKLFLGFYSGMSKDEFHEHAKGLVDQGLLIKRVINGVVSTKSSVKEYQYKIGENKHQNSAGVISFVPYGPTMKAEFSPEQSYRLVYIELDISGIHDRYSKKYNIPKLEEPFSSKEGSKIGVYNKQYEPKPFLNIKVKSQEFGIERTKRVDMPKLLLDRSRKLGLLEKQVYYNKIDWEEYIRGTSKLPEAEQLVEIDSSNSVLYYRKYWTSESREEFSIKKNIASMNINEKLNFSLKYWQEIETQSKQVITYIDYQRNTEVTYTTKQYYDEKIKKPIPVPQKPKPKIQRDFLDEI
tara:strand:- start:109 stop:1155 length:1047 start_codon:yes stop_codon:yes gene_type:complete